MEPLDDGSSTRTAPFDRYRDVVRPEWIDENDHMNMGYYVVVFDLATDAWLDHIGLDRAHKQSHSVTTFTLESHTCYLRELRCGDPLRFTTLLLGFDHKRIHYIHEMWHADRHYLAATNELMSLHVSQTTRRTAPIAPQVVSRLESLHIVHSRVAPPVAAGRRIGLDERPRNESTRNESPPNETER
jgi:acyl-CoA thioester hydrolase